jgi:hypothetical protein
MRSWHMARSYLPRFRRQGYAYTCPSGCWLERADDGSVYCVCGDTLLKGLPELSPTLKTALVFVAGVAAGYFGGGYLATRR